MGVFARAFLLLSLLGLASAAAALEAPPLSGRIVDRAGLLDADTQARIASTLRQLEETNAAQLAVLTVPGLEGDSLEAFSIRVVENWKLGRKGVDDGVLLLVVRDERRIRIEVGYGLEAVLTDLASRRIIDYLMVPAFREGNFAAGIEAAVDAMTRAIRGEAGAIPAGPAPSRGAAVQVDAQTQSLTGPMLFLGILSIILIPMAGFAVALKGDKAWFLYVFLAPFFAGSALPFGQTPAMIALVAWLAVFPLLRAVWPRAWQIESDTEEGTGRRPRSGSKSRVKSRSSGGLSGSSGFSGGGGRFGGGGASGGW